MIPTDSSHCPPKRRSSLSDVCTWLPRRKSPVYAQTYDSYLADSDIQFCNPFLKN